MPEHDVTRSSPAGCRYGPFLTRQPRAMYRLMVVIVLVAALLSLAACNSRPHPYYDELKALPGATLLYPDSHLVTALGSDSDNKMGGNPADYGNLALTHATAPGVLKYYDTQLRAKGWTRDDSEAIIYAPLDVSYGWARGERIFQLGFYGKEGIAKIIERNAKNADYRTVYETHLQ